MQHPFPVEHLEGEMIAFKEYDFLESDDDQMLFHAVVIPNFEFIPAPRFIPTNSI